ncbi:MAG: hypothetical protein Q8P67_21790, partial [archaeon]|nr:hypothetical protein [archaeon]
MFVWGAGGEFQLATEKPQDGSAHPLEVEPLRGLDITSVTAGWVTTFALTSRGEVFGWGSNQFWSLPTSSPDASSSHFVKPTRLALLHPQSKEPLLIKKVLAGRAHTLFLDHGGSIFSVGMSDLGQLGNGVQGESSFSKSPVAVEGPLADRVVVDIACGLDHNLALCRDGSVFSWGLAADGQLGLGDPEEGKDIVDTPQQIQYMATGEQVPEIAKVVAGSDNSALLTKDGQLLM